jgi:hypothetical protein
MRRLTALLVYLSIFVSPAFTQILEIPTLFKPMTSRILQSVELSAAESFNSAVSIDSQLIEQIVDEDTSVFLIPGTDVQSDTVYITRVIRHNQGYSIIGRINNSPYDSFTLSFADGKYLSRIHQPSKHQTRHLRYVNDLDTHALLDIDRNSLDILTCGIEEHEHFKIPDSTSPPKEKGFISPDLIQETSEIDVMIVYTPAAAQWASINGGGIQNVMNQAMALAQLSFDNSGVDINVKLVHTYQANYTETGDSRDDLSNITNGLIPNVHDLRNQHGADLVAFFTRTNDTGGVAWYLDNSNGRSDYGFSITRVQQASWTTTHAHEMAHNMGSDHSRNQSRSAASDGLLFEYSTGWRWRGNDGRVYLSVMTYDNPEDQDPGTEVEYFSNPAVNYQGVPTGSYSGPYAPADNARSLNEMREVISNYRPSSGGVIEEPEISLCEALDNCDLVFRTGGNSNWFGQTQEYTTGESAARSGQITHNQTSWVETTIVGPGKLSFEWKVSSEEWWDNLLLTVNGTFIIGITGEEDWNEITLGIPEGEYTVRWSYEKDESFSQGADRAWLDAVVFESNIKPQITVNLLDKWNMVGLPVQMSHSSYLELFPNALNESLFDFNTSYQGRQTLQPGKGYWVRMEQSGSATFTGEAITSLDIDLQKGWNLISGPTEVVSVEAIEDPQEIIITGSVFGFNGSYETTTNLEPGKGYWVRTSEAGPITLSPGSSNKSSGNLLSSLLSNFNRIEFNAGNDDELTATLYLNGSIPSPYSAINFELPPVPPAGNMDVRWEGGSYVTETSEAVALIQQGTSPIQVLISNSSTDIETGTHAGTVLIREFIGDRLLAEAHIQRQEHYTLSSQTDRIEFELQEKSRPSIRIHSRPELSESV